MGARGGWVRNAGRLSDAYFVTGAGVNSFERLSYMNRVFDKDA